MKAIMDLHTHSLASVHAYSTITENARNAKLNGLQIMGASDHGYGMAHTTTKEFWVNLRCWPEYLEGVRLLKGLEANIYNHKGDLFEEALLDHVDYVIASLHGNAYEFDTRDERDYTSAMVNAMRRYPQINILGHPDDSRYPVDYEQVIRAAVDCHVAVEVNVASLQPNAFRPGAEENMRRYLALCRAKQCPIIINSDAHFATHVGAFDRAYALLEDINFPEELVINTSWSRLEALLGKTI